MWMTMAKVIGFLNLKRFAYYVNLYVYFNLCRHAIFIVIKIFNEKVPLLYLL